MDEKDTAVVKPMFLPLFNSKEQLEFVGAFEVYIDKNAKSGLKINDDLTLSAEDQKLLRKKSLIETNNYSLFYIFKVDGNYLGSLYVFKKKQPAPSPSDTLK